MKCGDVVLLNYPFTDDSGAKVRPALIVSADTFNRGEDVTLVPISSVAEPGDHRAFPINAGDSFFVQTGLRRSSFVKWTKPLTISKKVIMRRLGSLNDKLLGEIQSKVRSVFESR